MSTSYYSYSWEGKGRLRIELVGVQVKLRLRSLENTCHRLPERFWGDDSRRGPIKVYVPLPLRESWVIGLLISETLSRNLIMLVLKARRTVQVLSRLLVNVWKSW